MAKNESLMYTFVLFTEPKSQYQFQVAAMTKKGVGEKSNTYRSYTDATGNFVTPTKK